MKLRICFSVKADDSLFIAKARGGVINRSNYYCSCVNKSTEIDTVFSDEANCDWQDAMPVCAAPQFAEEQCKFRAKRDGYDDMDIDIPLDVVKFEPAPPNVCQKYAYYSIYFFIQDKYVYYCMVLLMLLKEVNKTVYKYVHAKTGSHLGEIQKKS